MTDTPTPEERAEWRAFTRRRIALHEAGHAVAHLEFRIPLEYASIRPGRTFAGVAVPALRDEPDYGEARFGAPAPLQPETVRADIERRAIASLAGDIAALYLADAPAGAAYGGDEAETIARDALAGLASRVAELVVSHETSEEPTPGDEAAARYLAALIAGPVPVDTYLAWLRVLAHEFVIRFRTAILAVADALEASGVLSGDQVAAIVKES